MLLVSIGYRPIRSPAFAHRRSSLYGCLSSNHRRSHEQIQKLAMPHSRSIDLRRIPLLLYADLWCHIGAYPMGNAG
jgi:hypothetical protein